MKKTSHRGELMSYAGGHKYLTYLSLLLSAVSAVLALFPFVFLFRIIQEVIEVSPNFAQATHVVRNGWIAVLFAVLCISGQPSAESLYSGKCTAVPAQRLPAGGGAGAP